MGPTEMGNPFLLVIITSPANQARLEELRQMNLKLSDPRGVPEAEIKRIVAEGKVFICQTMSMHASEMGGAQMAPELTYDLVSRTDEETQRILDNVVYLRDPVVQPGRRRSWSPTSTTKYVGTEYEGGGAAVALQQVHRPRQQPRRLHDEHEGVPVRREADVRGLEAAGLRGSPPHGHLRRADLRAALRRADPPARRIRWSGARCSGTAATSPTRKKRPGLSGVMNTGQYSGWGHFGFHWITPFHNIAGMLTESASAKLATPLYIDPSQLTGGAAEPRDLQGADELPESVAGRLVDAPGHRRAAEGVGLGARWTWRRATRRPCCGTPT